MLNLINYIWNDFISKYGYILRYWVLELWHMNFGRAEFNP
jgi:hypothetical protein